MSNGYYNNIAPPPNNQYAMDDGAKYGQQQQGYNQNYAQNNYAPPPGPPQQYNQQPGYGNEKITFDQQFKIERPKYNDLWAAILFLAVFAGFTAVSGIAIHGYCK